MLLLLGAFLPRLLEAATTGSRHLDADPARVCQVSRTPLAYTLRAGRRPFAHRRAVVAEGIEEAIAALRSRDPKRSGPPSMSGTPFRGFCCRGGDQYRASPRPLPMASRCSGGRSPLRRAAPPAPRARPAECCLLGTRERRPRKRRLSRPRSASPARRASGREERDPPRGPPRGDPRRPPAMFAGLCAGKAVDVWECSRRRSSATAWESNGRCWRVMELPTSGAGGPAGPA